MKNNPGLNLLKKLDRAISNWLYVAPPAPLKQEDKVKVFLEYIKRFSLETVVETGTYEGATVRALQNHAKNIISIELDSELCRKAKAAFAHIPNVLILNGDSEVVIPKVLESLSEPTFFWLDGHYSGDGTAKGDLDSPIIRELQCIFDHPIKNHVILIDDARFFIGEGGYPKMQDLFAHVSKNHPNADILVEDDIIRITPTTSNSSAYSYHEPLRTKAWHFYRKFKRAVKETFRHDKN